MKRLLMVIPLIILYCFTNGCQQGEEAAEQPSADAGMDAQMIQNRVAELEAATNSANSIIGSWILNVEKSNFAEGQSVPKEQTEAYRASLDQIELTFKNIESDGSSNLYVITFPDQGGINKWSKGDNQGAMEVETLLTPYEWIMTRLQDGKQVGTLHKVISEDGQTMRQTETGTDDQGKAYESILIYDRQ